MFLQDNRRGSMMVSANIVEAMYNSREYFKYLECPQYIFSSVHVYLSHVNAGQQKGSMMGSANMVEAMYN